MGAAPQVQRCGHRLNHIPGARRAEEISVVIDPGHRRAGASGQEGGDGACGFPQGTVEATIGQTPWLQMLWPHGDFHSHRARRQGGVLGAQEQVEATNVVVVHDRVKFC